MADSRDSPKTIIFTATKRTADSLTKDLRDCGFSALAIHGDKKQQERDWVMKEFKCGRSPILIATDVAARGLGMSLCQRALCNSQSQGLSDFGYYALCILLVNKSDDISDGIFLRVRSCRV